MKDKCNKAQREARKSIAEIATEFEACRLTLAAIGDETRQQIILALLGRDEGVRVGEITERTNLSRPAVSHHVKVLKDAGMIGVRRVGTMNFYFLDYDSSELIKIERLCRHVRDLVVTPPGGGSRARV